MKASVVVALALLAGAQQTAQQKPPAVGAPKDFAIPAARRWARRFRRPANGGWSAAPARAGG